MTKYNLTKLIVRDIEPNDRNIQRCIDRGAQAIKNDENYYIRKKSRDHGEPLLYGLNDGRGTQARPETFHYDLLFRYATTERKKAETHTANAAFFERIIEELWGDSPPPSGLFIKRGGID